MFRKKICLKLILTVLLLELSLPTFRHLGSIFQNNTHQRKTCQEQYNEEFNFYLGMEMPVPMSIFHRDRTIFMIFSGQNFVPGLRSKVKLHNLSLLVKNFKQWFMTDTWSITFIGTNGQEVVAACEPIYNPKSLVLVVTCSVEPHHILYAIYFFIFFCFKQENVFFIYFVFFRSDIRINVTASISTSSGVDELNFQNLLSCKESNVADSKTLELAACMLVGGTHVKRIPEFLAYHSMVGIEKFFIYYNDNPKKSIENWHYFEPFVNSGLVEVVPYYFKTKDFFEGLQLPAYHDCLFKAKGKVKWLAFVDADEFFQLQQPNSHFKSLLDLVQSYKDNSTAFMFSTFSYAYQGDAEAYIENCVFPSFINDWLWSMDESNKRLPKSIYLTDANDYIRAHFSITLGVKKTRVAKSEAILAHYRYPYKAYTLNNIFNENYSTMPTFKNSYGAQVIDKLHSFGFRNYKINCTKQ